MKNSVNDNANWFTDYFIFETNVISQLFIYFVLHVVENIVFGASLCIEDKRKLNRYSYNDDLNGILSPICILKKDVYSHVLRTDGNYDEIILKLKRVIPWRKYKTSVTEDNTLITAHNISRYQPKYLV